MQLNLDLRCAIWAEVNVLISGACAEVRQGAARMIHEWTNPRGGRFVVLKSSGRAQLRVLRELFQRREPATVFIEEAGELDLSLQDTLLSLLRSSAGDAVRVIAGTGVDMMARIKAARFRPDLFYRLNTVHLVLEPQSVLVHASYCLYIPRRKIQPPRGPASRARSTCSRDR